MAVKQDAGAFNAADFLAGVESNSDTVTWRDTPALSGQWRFAVARWDNLGAVSKIRQYGEEPDDRSTFTPAEGLPQDVVVIAGGRYNVYTSAITVQGFLVTIPWELT